MTRPTNSRRKKVLRRKLNRKFYKVDRERLWIEQDKKCKYCKRKLERHEITMDHVIPISKTKIHSTANCVVACKNCNGSKSDNEVYTPSEFQLKLIEVLHRLDERTKKAEYNIYRFAGLNTRGSFSKWKKYQAKNK